MKSFPPALAAVLLASTLHAQPAPVAPQAPHHSAWVFELMPKSFQKRPRLDFHVITEMTDAGRKLTPPTARQPVYYIAQAGTFTQLGNNTPGNEHPPSVTELTHAMQRALAADSYLPAQPGGPLPALAVVFNYGSFARFSTDFYDFQQMLTMDELSQSSDPNAGPAAPFIPSDGDRDAESLLPIVLSSPTAREDVIRRADLIGGDKFARELSKAINDEAMYQQGRGDSGTWAGWEISSPFHQFLNHNQDTMDLVEESFSSCYFVVASAYDYAAMRHGKRVLLWRTKMTVNSSGISMGESLPTLVTTAGPYFGRDMTGPVTLTHRIDREGKVEVGEPVVVPDEAVPDGGTAAPAPKR